MDKDMELRDYYEGRLDRIRGYNEKLCGRINKGKLTGME